MSTRKENTSLVSNDIASRHPRVRLILQAQDVNNPYAQAYWNRKYIADLTDPYPDSGTFPHDPRNGYTRPNGFPSIELIREQLAKARISDPTTKDEDLISYPPVEYRPSTREETRAYPHFPCTAARLPGERVASAGTLQWDTRQVTVSDKRSSVVKPAVQLANSLLESQERLERRAESDTMARQHGIAKAYLWSEYIESKLPDDAPSSDGKYRGTARGRRLNRRSKQLRLKNSDTVCVSELAGSSTRKSETVLPEPVRTAYRIAHALAYKTLQRQRTGIRAHRTGTPLSKLTATLKRNRDGSIRKVRTHQESGKDFFHTLPLLAEAIESGILFHATRLEKPVTDREVISLACREADREVFSKMQRTSRVSFDRLLEEPEARIIPEPTLREDGTLYSPEDFTPEPDRVTRVWIALRLYWNNSDSRKSKSGYEKDETILTEVLCRIQKEDTPARRVAVSRLVTHLQHGWALARFSDAPPVSPSWGRNGRPATLTV
jgi:hypothetical protein